MPIKAIRKMTRRRLNRLLYAERDEDRRVLVKTVGGPPVTASARERVRQWLTDLGWPEHRIVEKLNRRPGR